MKKAYIYRHVVGFEETNLVGNVYYANHVRWQGKCREMFLRDHAPSILDDLAKGLALITLRVSCEYLSELVAFDEIEIEMRLGDIVQNRVTMLFNYFKEENGNRILFARGEQQIACMQRHEDGLIAIPIPTALKTALETYRI